MIRVKVCYLCAVDPFAQLAGEGSRGVMVGRARAAINRWMKRGLTKQGTYASGHLHNNAWDR